MLNCRTFSQISWATGETVADTRSGNTTTDAPSTAPAPGPAFAPLGAVQLSLIFTLTSLVVPLPG